MGMPQEIPPASSSGASALASAPAALDGALFRQVMGLFTTGITVITTEVEGRPHGMTANAFMAGSLDPPLCVISIGKKTRLHAHLTSSGRYGVSFLSEEQSYLSNHFAGRGVVAIGPEFRALDGVPVLTRALAVIAANVVDRVDCGDHSLFIGRITQMDAAPAAPLLFFRSRYVRLASTRDSAPVDAPTFW